MEETGIITSWLSKLFTFNNLKNIDVDYITILPREVICLILSISENVIKYF